MLQHSRTGDRIPPASKQASHKCPFNISTCPGCHAESQLEGHPNVRDDVSNDRTNGLQVEVYSPATARLQLREEFRHIFFPAPFGRDADFMYCRFLGGKCLQPQGASMTAAVDLLCLLQMSVRTMDKTLLQEASNLYDLTLANLKIDLERPNAAQNDGMVAAIWILHWCDSFTPTRGTTCSTQIHKQAAEQILVSRGPEAELSELAQLLLYNVRLTGTSFGMISRKPVPSAGRGWAKRAAWAGTIENELIETLLQIPDLLYRLDQLTSQRGRPKYYDTYSVLQVFTHMEEELISWLTRWMRTLPGEVFHYVCASQFPHLQLLTQTVTDVFSSVIEYPSFATASLQMTYWTGLMQVKWSIMELLDLLQDHSLLRVRRSGLVEDLDQCADLLCQSAAFTTQPQYGYCGILRCLGPVYFAAKWFHYRGQWRKLHWAHVLTESVNQAYQFTSPYALPPEPATYAKVFNVA